MRAREREARQRWRLTVARDESVAGLTERATLEALAAGFASAGLPVAEGSGARPRPRIALAAALPRGAESESELVELYLSERLPTHQLRERVIAGLPPGFRLVGLEDEWVGAPSLASRVSAVEYRAVVSARGALTRGDLEAAIDQVVRTGAGSGGITIQSWSDAAARGELTLRFERESSGRFGRPAEAFASIGRGLRIERLVRTAVELAGEAR